MLEVAKEEFQYGGSRNMLPIQKSVEQSAHMVPKEAAGKRPCGNYRRLNVITIPDRYPVPNLSDLETDYRVQQYIPHWIW